MSKKKLRFLFQGDSVTDTERNRDTDDLGKGYPLFFKQAYEEISKERDDLPEFEFINKGISGDRSIEILERLEEDILRLKPDYLSLQIGVNDAWRLLNPDVGATPDPVYERSVEAVLQRVREELPETKIIMIEPFLIVLEDEFVPVRRNLYQKIDILRELRREYADFYWPLDGLIHQWSMDYEEPAALAFDGIHPTEVGHRRIAQEMVDILVETGFIE